jgi:hypothetical protein
MSNGPSVEQLTRAFIKIRDRRSEIKREFEAEDSQLLRKQDQIRAALMEHCKEHEVDSVKTAAGTFYRTVKRKFWTSNWAAMHQFILEHEVPELLDKRINQTNIRQFLEDNPELVPPGLNAETEYVISVRKT